MNAAVHGSVGKSYPHRNAAITHGRLRGQRSVVARSKYAAVVASFLDAGKGDLLQGPPWQKAAIRQHIIDSRLELAPLLPRRRVPVGALTHDVFGTGHAAETLAEAFIKYLQRREALQ